MAVSGSFRDDSAWNPLTIHLMCMDTTIQSGDKLQESVREKTPYKTGALRESILQGPMTRPYAGRQQWYRIEVSSEDPKARWIEYGTPPHIIEPRRVNGKRGALVFNAAEYDIVHHPGADGFHMFTRGGAEFERLHAEVIAKKNLRKFLGARTTT